MKHVIVSKIANSTGKSKKDISEIYDAIFDEIKKELADNQKVVIKEFGTFAVKQREASIIKHPKTGEEIQLPARKAPHFKISKKLKEFVNQ